MFFGLYVCIFRTSSSFVLFFWLDEVLFVTSFTPLQSLVLFSPFERVCSLNRTHPDDSGCVVETYWLPIGRLFLRCVSTTIYIPFLSSPLMRITYHLIDIDDLLRFIHRFHVRSCIIPLHLLLLPSFHYLLFCLASPPFIAPL
jgi:hypothetical protein